jgi:hypothetical protein
MTTRSARASMPEEGSIASDLARGVLGFLWHAIRLPILFCLLILEPFVRVLLSGAALLGVLTASIYKGSTVSHDPFWFLIWMSLGCVVVLVVYHGLIRLFS